jgi:hypothetical protein
MAPGGFDPNRLECLSIWPNEVSVVRFGQAKLCLEQAYRLLKSESCVVTLDEDEMRILRFAALFLPLSRLECQDSGRKSKRIPLSRCA